MESFEVDLISLWNSFAAESSIIPGLMKNRKERNILNSDQRIWESSRMYLPYNEVDMASPDTFWKVSLGIENKSDSKRSGSSTVSLESEGKGLFSPVLFFSLAPPDSYTIYVMSESWQKKKQHAVFWDEDPVSYFWSFSH